MWTMRTAPGTWTYATSVGSIGTRTLNVRVAGADRVYQATDVDYTVRIIGSFADNSNP